MRKAIPVTVLTGYLGSGKTTLVNRILADPQGMKIAVIVNDIGEVNIDAALIAQKGHASVGDDSLVALTNGCICCSLQMDLIEQIMRLVKAGCFDYILIEASGICEPLPIAQSISMIDGSLKDRGIPALCRLDSVITVVDAYRLLTEFSGGDALLQHEEEDIAGLLVEQIEFCNLVVLNKTDLLTEKETAKIEAIIHALQPSAQVLKTSFANVPAKDILNIHLFDFAATFLSAGWAQAVEHEKAGEHQAHHHAEYGISTFVYYRRRPFDGSRLEAWVHQFPSGVIRSKGLVWLDGDGDTSFLLEQAGRSVSVQPFSSWLAAASVQEREETWARDPATRDNWDEQVGDRMTKLVFIGADMDKEEICASLDRCLA